MAENKIPDSEIREGEKEKLTVEDAIVDKGSVAMIEDLREDEITTGKKDRDEDERDGKDKNKNKNNPIGDETDDKDEVEGAKTNDKDKIEGDKTDAKDKIEGNETDDKDKVEGDKIDDKSKDEVTKSEEFVKSTISASLPTDDIIIELKVMNERCILLTDEIQQLKREVFELSEKPELTEEDTLAIQEKQDILTSKVAELEQLTQKCQKVL